MTQLKSLHQNMLFVHEIYAKSFNGKELEILMGSRCTGEYSILFVTTNCYFDTFIVRRLCVQIQSYVRHSNGTVTAFYKKMNLLAVVNCVK